MRWRRSGEGLEIPLPAECGADDTVALPLLTELEVRLYETLRRDAPTRAELARRLGWNRESVDRLFRLDHHSRREQIEPAFAALRRPLTRPRPPPA